MFTDLWANLKTIIAAFDNTTVDKVGDALAAAGELLKQGYSIFKDLFANRLGFQSVEPLAACKAMVAEHESGMLFAADAQAWDGSRLLNILNLIKKLMDLFM